MVLVVALFQFGALAVLLAIVPAVLAGAAVSRARARGLLSTDIGAARCSAAESAPACDLPVSFSPGFSDGSHGTPVFP